MNNYSNYIKIGIGLIIGIGLLFLWLSLIDLDEVKTHIANVKIIYLVPAITFYLLSYFLRSLRLRHFLNDKSKIPVLKNYGYILMGNLLNYLIPIRAGEIAKGYFYKKNHDLRWSESMPAIFIDKIMDTFLIFIIIILIPFAGFTFSIELNFLIFLLMIVFLIGIGILFIASINERLIVHFIQKFFFFIPKKYKDKIFNFINLFVSNIAVFSKKKIFSTCLLLTILATLSDSLFFFMMFVSFGISIEFMKVVFGYTLMFLSFILPHPPAQIGSNEIYMVLIFSEGFGFERNLVSAVMILSHFVTAIVNIITGTLGIIYARSKK